MTPPLRVRSAVVYVALCERDDCPWKHRGVTAAVTWAAARLHVDVGHTVAVYEDHKLVERIMRSVTP